VWGTANGPLDGTRCGILKVSPFQLKLGRVIKLGARADVVIDTGTDIVAVGHSLVQKPLKGKQAGFNSGGNAPRSIGALGHAFIISAGGELFTTDYRSHIPQREGSADVVAQTVGDRGWLGVDRSGYILTSGGLPTGPIQFAGSVELLPGAESTLLKADQEYIVIKEGGFTTLPFPAQRGDHVFSFDETFWCFRSPTEAAAGLVKPLNGATHECRWTVSGVRPPVVFPDQTAYFFPTRYNAKIEELHLGTIQRQQVAGRSDFSGVDSVVGCIAPEAKALLISGQNKDGGCQALALDPHSGRPHTFELPADLPQQRWQRSQWLIRERHVYLMVTVEDESWLLEYDGG